MVKSHSVEPRSFDLQNKKHILHSFHLSKWIPGLVHNFVAFLWVECALIALVLIGTGVIFVI